MSDDKFIALFKSASDFVRNRSSQFDERDLILLYALYKQATIGDCFVPEPSYFDFKAKVKYKAWKSLRSISSKEAMKKYVEFLDSICADWKISSPEQKSWISVSCMRNVDEYVSDSEKNIFDWVKDENLDKIKESNFVVNCRDHNGLTPLHWAADRGSLQIVKYLVDTKKSSLNLVDEEGQSPLHYAVACGHRQVIDYLIEAGADLDLADNNNLKAKDLAESEEISKLFDRKQSVVQKLE